MAATQGHTQSLHTNALDEALALPTDFSARIARNTQLLLQQESGTTRVIDPWGGSAYVERLTYELARTRLGAHPGGRGGRRDGQGDRGGHPQAAHRGGGGPHPGADRLRPPAGHRRQQVPPRRRRRHRRAQGRQRGGARPAARQARAAPRRARRGRLPGRARPADRAPPAVGSAGDEDNLLALAIDAARAKATVGEISDALEKVFGRYTGQIRTISGVYRQEAGETASHRAGPRRGRRVRARPKAAGPASWSPRWARTATTAARRSSPPRSPTSASTSTSARCSRRPARWPARPSRPTSTSSGVNSLAAGHLTLVPALKAALADARPRRHHDRRRRRHPARRTSTSCARPARPRSSRPGTVIPEAAVDLLTSCRWTRSTRGRDSRPATAGVSATTRIEPDAARYADAVLAGQARGDRPRDHAGRVDPPRPPGQAQQLLTRLLPHAGQARRVGITGVPGAGKSTLIDALGGRLIDQRAPGRGARGRPVLDPHRRQHPRRQDPDGQARHRPGTRSSAPRRPRARSAASPARPASRSGRHGGRRLRRRARRDGRRRASPRRSSPR